MCSTKCFFSVSFLLLVQFVLNLYHNLKEWLKNLHWSLSCCLALLLPLKELQGEISGLAATNLFHEQLQANELVVPTILAAVKNSGAIDVVLEESEQGDDGTIKAHGTCQAEYRSKQCHRWTQTEPLSLLFADIVVHEQIDEIPRVNTRKCKVRTYNMQYISLAVIYIVICLIDYKSTGAFY